MRGYVTPGQVYSPEENLRYYLERVVSPDDRRNAPRFGFAGDGTITGVDPVLGGLCMTVMRCSRNEIIDARGRAGNFYRVSTLHGTNMADGAE